MYRFIVSVCHTVSQFNDNSRIQFNESKGRQGITTVKTLEFQNMQEAKSKNAAITKKKNEQYARQIINTNQ